MTKNPYTRILAAIASVGFATHVTLAAPYTSKFPSLKLTRVEDIFSDVINPIAAIMFDILIALSIVFIIAAAYQYLTSGGDPEKVKKATKMITYAVVALVVGLLAKSIPLVISDFFDLSKGGTPGGGIIL